MKLEPATNFLLNRSDHSYSLLNHSWTSLPRVKYDNHWVLNIGTSY